MPRYSINLSLLLGVCLVVFTTCGRVVSQSQPVPEWPEVTSDNQIWTRWWWHGSSVTEAGITAELQSLSEAGFGGVELTPIFGVIGEEDSFVDYLSPRWMELLDHTLTEAKRLGMQVDMATGTGWPFGGPWIGRENAPKYLAHRSFEVSEGERLTEEVTYMQEPIFRRVNNEALRRYRSAESATTTANPITIDDIDPVIGNNADLQALTLDQVRFAEELPLVSLMAYGEAGEVVDLTQRVAPSGTLDWVAPAGNWKLYALFEGLHGKMVERAAPGGEGNVIDHFSAEAIDHYLQRFDEAFAGHDVSGIRAFFNDSYEVDDARGQANWTPAFLQHFEQQRGYDLRHHLPALFGEAEEAENTRVLSDFRETFSELILETFTKKWDGWADAKQAIIRNQAHGSPANILDLYAASDIPETEGTQSLRIKFATSAANVTGKPLVSAEAATWLDEHFVATWSDLKANLDQYLVNGVNHLVYHGTAYSPAGDPFPGRLFYAAFHANSRHPMWDDLEAVNTYVTRTQSFLQRASSDNDILLYFPVYDRFATPGAELLQHFDGHGPNLEESRVARLGEELLAAGHTFDFVSDAQLQATSFEGGEIRTAGGTYRTVLVPATRYMPEGTWEALLELARAGATIVFQEQLPPSVPGLNNWREREEQRGDRIAAVEFASADGVSTARTGSGKLVVADRWEKALSETGISPEPLVASGLAFNRRNYLGGKLYFISNWSDSDVDDWVPLATAGAAAVLYDPMTGERGLARTETVDEALSVRLQLPRGSSIMVWVSPTSLGTDPWPYFEAAGRPTALDGTWKLEFLKGGPELPASTELATAEVWTAQSDATYRFFSGTGRYSTTFARPAGGNSDYLLDLGRVYETARVSLNGNALGTLTGPTFRLRIPANLIKDQNTLTVDVSNRMINRMIKMDRDQVFWKKFYNVNLPARLRENTGPLGVFDASNWEPVPSGLAGPVTLTAGTSATDDN
ncbi:hypothetical protein GGR28_003625 [Lewinella aquimaris]|uniref:Alpha-L-rhamnosidase-like protein n=1 Tax=Neolewinella aquimaris TaxID=1835722 RepID=A0A840E5R1_9BACT|nr:glycosyl hydrolase [Neolewinella aquimaris]MBB4080984.1 hypothetical protein [Neolewinella aquimaris]